MEESFSSVCGTIRLHKDDATGAVMYELEGYGQSAADADGISMASYIHALFGLLSQAKSRNVLVLGGAGGTLATLLVRARAAVTLVDIDPKAFELARNFFHLPASVTCHVADAQAFLQTGTQTFDAIVLDVFVGNHIPEHLQTQDFFAAAQKRLAPGGVMLANVHVKHDFDDFADRMALAMRASWPLVRVLDAIGKCPRNAVVMAGAVEKLRPPKLLVPSSTNPGGLRKELADLAFRTWKASRWDFGR